MIPAEQSPPTSAEHVDVLIVGAGLSGIGAAAHLTRARSPRSYAILESRDSSGGTWDLFRYPGIRSDSDMYTLGYRFRPWRGEKSIADGPSILRYLRETATEYDVDRHVRYGHQVVSADWDSTTARWTVTALQAGRTVQLTCGVLWSCAGYFDYDTGHVPDLAGVEDYRGIVVHPQQWPEDLEHAGRRVLVVGSGATAVTLVPALAGSGAAGGSGAAEHVTMLQRSPTYILSVPGVDPIAARLRRWLSPRASYRAIRWKNVVVVSAFYRFCRRWPGAARRLIRRATVRQLPVGYDVDADFRPRYDPWDQRLCVVPDADLFRAIREGRASIVTDSLDRFTPSGVRLGSGAELEADIVVLATGLVLAPFGRIDLSVDGVKVSLPETMGYRGLMLSGVPNFVFTVGYTNASWTLKADLVAEFVCRVLEHQDRTGFRTMVPVRDPSVATVPFMDFTSGYVVRALDRLPTQGDREPWRLKQSYLRDRRTLRKAPLDDGVLRFS